MTQLNPYQLRRAQVMGTGVTLPQHIAELFAKYPQKLNDVMTRTYTANRPPLMSTILDKKAAVKTFADDSEYTWDLVGAYENNVSLVECRDEMGTVVDSSYEGKIGQGGAHFQLVFDNQYFADGENLVGEKGSYFLFKITGEPISEGSNTVYNVVLTTGAQTGADKEDLLPGKKFSFFGSAVSNVLSRKAGGIRRHTSTSMRNEFTTIRKYHKYIGAADKQLKLETAIPLERYDANGKVQQTTVKSWFDNETWIYNKEWQEEKNRWMMFGRSNRNANGSYFGWDKSGMVERHGDGLIPQGMYSGVTYYNTFSIKAFADAIYARFDQGAIPFSERHIVAVTGSWGLVQVNEAIAKETAGFMGSMTGMTVNADALGIVNKVSSQDGINNALGFGAQFTQWRGANGLVIDFVCDPALDDKTYNKIPGFNGNGVLSSYAYFVFDLGSDAEPNIFKCKVEGSEDITKFRIGLRNPFGISNNNIINYDEDSAEVHSFAQFGALIKDSERVLIYMPTGLYI